MAVALKFTYIGCGMGVSNEPVLMVGEKPLMTERGVQHRLESGGDIVFIMFKSECFDFDPEVVMT